MISPIVRHIKLSLALDLELGEKEKRIKNFFDNIFENLEEYTLENYPNDIFYGKYVDDKLYYFFRQDLKNERMWVDYNSIWEKLEVNFGLNHKEISYLTQGMLELHLNRKVYTTAHLVWKMPLSVGTTFKT